MQKEEKYKKDTIENLLKIKCGTYYNEIDKRRKTCTIGSPRNTYPFIYNFE